MKRLNGVGRAERIAQGRDSVLTTRKSPLFNFLLALIAALFLGQALAGCDSLPTSPDEATVDGKTSLGIGVQGGGSELHDRIDQAWLDDNRCWGMSLDARRITVIVKQPAFKDDSGTMVFKDNGQYYYGLRSGNSVWVCPDLAALRHEFSHIVGEASEGHQVNNDSGRCWL